VKHGRYGDFLACPGFPECRSTKPILKETGVQCPKCAGNIVERRTKRGKIFYGCKNYPTCDFMTWDMPLKENCQTCGAFMLRHNFKNGRFSTLCSNEACVTRQSVAEKKVVDKAKTTTKPKIQRKAKVVATTKAKAKKDK
jgi:DNA topoisomerase-1